MGRFKKYIEYFSIYLVLMVPQSLMSAWYIKEAKVLFMAISVIVLLTNRKTIKIGIRKCSSDILKLLIVTFILLNLVIHTNGSFNLNDVRGLLLNNFIFIYIIFQAYKKQFVKDYINIICFLAAISLLGFTIQVIDKGYVLRTILPNLSLKSSFPINLGDLGEVRGGLLYVFNNGIHKNRNSGVYPEPGMYQFFLNIGLYFLLFVCKEIVNKNRIVYMIILIGTILTTQSTTGYISLIIILSLYITQRHINTKAKAQLIVLFAVLSCLIFATPALSSKVMNVINSKIRITGGTSNINFLLTGSGSTRTRDTKEDIKIFLGDKYGRGYKGYSSLWASEPNEPGERTKGSSSNSLTYTFAVYGMFFALFMIILYFSSFIGHSNSFNQGLALALFFLNTVMAQGLFLNPLFIIFIFSDSSYLCRGNESPRLSGGKDGTTYTI
jgi:hypothetical protein